MTDFNTLLRRTVQDGSQFDKLIPKSTCQVVLTGKGMTDYTVKQMAGVVKKYYRHMVKVAPGLKKSSLEATCYAIHKFCYDHFQYKIDETTQKLRSPACSWYQRKTGIDCKSYSIVASSILTNLGIKHYIRRVKQLLHTPRLWSHVYIIVPINQQTGSLASGYYTIDGTVINPIEPAIKEKDDLFMMDHEVLAGAYHQGLGVGVEDFKKINLNSLKGLIKGLDCIGGSSFKPGQLDQNLNIMNVFFNGIVDKINAAAQQKNMAELSEQVNMFKGNAGLFAISFRTKKSEGWNSCTTDNLDACIKIADFYRVTCGKALQAWLSEYFNTTGVIGEKVFLNPGNPNTTIEKTMGLNFTYTGGGSVWKEKKYSYSQKAANVPAFAITSYVLEANNGTFNSSSFLQTLVGTVTTVGNIIKPAPENNLNTSGNKIDETTQDFNDKKVTAAGFGVAGYVLLAIAAGYVFKQMKDTGTAAKKQSMRTTPPKKITV